MGNGEEGTDAEAAAGMGDDEFVGGENGERKGWLFFRLLDLERTRGEGFG